MGSSSTLMAEDTSQALARERNVSVTSHSTRSKCRDISWSSCCVRGNCNLLQSQGQWRVSFFTTPSVGTELDVLIINVTFSANSWDGYTHGMENPRMF